MIFFVSPGIQRFNIYSFRRKHYYLLSSNIIHFRIYPGCNSKMRFAGGGDAFHQNPFTTAVMLKKVSQIIRIIVHEQEVSLP